MKQYESISFLKNLFLKFPFQITHFLESYLKLYIPGDSNFMFQSITSSFDEKEFSTKNQFKWKQMYFKPSCHKQPLHNLPHRVNISHIFFK